MFFVDLSKSMSKRDITGRQGSRRIDAVVRCSSDLLLSRLPLEPCWISTVSSHFQVQSTRHRQRGAEAVSSLAHATFQPLGHVNYDQIVAAAKELVVPGQACRVIFLSDGCAAKLAGHVLRDFQAMVAENAHMILHSIGFGDCDFSILQQLAQIGRGSFNRAAMDIENIVNTFTSLSQTITQTRNTDEVQTRVTRSVWQRYKV